MTTRWEGEGAPRTRQEVATVVYRDVSRTTRGALLTLHTERTITQARLALLNPWKWAGRRDALDILTAAAPKYERLGGDLDPWKEGR